MCTDTTADLVYTAVAAAAVAVAAAMNSAAHFLCLAHDCSHSRRTFFVAPAVDMVTIDAPVVAAVVAAEAVCIGAVAAVLEAASSYCCDDTVYVSAVVGCVDSVRGPCAGWAVHTDCWRDSGRCVRLLAALCPSLGIQPGHTGDHSQRWRDWFAVDWLWPTVVLQCH